MWSSPTSSPVSSLTLRYRMRAMLRSSSWLNDTLRRRTALNSLTGIDTSPNEIVPLHTGRAMSRVNHIRAPTKPNRRRGLPRRRDRSSAGEDGARHDVHAEAGEDRKVQQTGGRHDGGVRPLL